MEWVTLWKGCIMNDENKELEENYKKMGQDKQQMTDAISMANTCIGDVGNESLKINHHHYEGQRPV